MLVKINNVDYSNNLVTEYDINNKKEYSDWTDSNGNKHIELKRQSIQGTLKFKFTESQYKKFLQDISNVKTDNFYTITVFCLNTQETKDIQAYIEFFPTIKKDVRSGKIYNIIEVTVEQK